MEDLTIDFSRSDQITEAERAMLHYAAKLTHSVAALQKDDVERLQRHQFSDRAILEINQIAGYFAYVNRLASGLGVELEDFWNTSHT